MVGFESNLKGRAQLLLVASRSKGLPWWALSRRGGGWEEDWKELAQSAAGTSNAGSHFSKVCVPITAFASFAGQEVRDHHPILQLSDASAQGPVVRAGLYPRLEADVCS